MSYCLIIIDVQNYFIAARNLRLRKNIKKEILTAKKQKAHIMFVEYKHCGPSLPSLTEAARGYKRLYTVLKTSPDGSDEVINALKKKKLPQENLFIVGVNSDQCVQATVTGLSKKLKKSKIHVVSGGCHSNYVNGNYLGISDMKNLPQVVIVGRMPSKKKIW